MFEKSGKFYADWRDRTGARKRKSFASARAALRHEQEQKDAAHPNAPARRNRWQKSSAPGTSHSRTAIANTKQQSSSSRQPEASSRANSAARSSRTLTNNSTARPTPTQPKRSAPVRSAASSATCGNTTEARILKMKSANIQASDRAVSRLNARRSIRS